MEDYGMAGLKARFESHFNDVGEFETGCTWERTIKHISAK